MQQLGHGEFGAVVHVRHKLDGGEYAVKMTPEKLVLSDADLQRALFEGQIMRRVAGACPSAVRYHDMWLEKLIFKGHTVHQVFIRMELCGRSLQALHDDGENVSEQQAWHVLEQVRRRRDVVHICICCRRLLAQPQQQREHLLRRPQVASVLSTMHELGFAHLDVKLDNILSSGDHTYKLVDYGLTARLGDRAVREEGDRRYLAPELLAGKYTHLDRADVFSLGISVYQLLSGDTLPSVGPQYTALRDGRAPPPCPEASDQLKSILEVRASRAVSPLRGEVMRVSCMRPEQPLSGRRRCGQTLRAQGMMQPDPASRPSSSQVLARCQQHRLQRHSEDGDDVALRASVGSGVSDCTVKAGVAPRSLGPGTITHPCGARTAATIGSLTTGKVPACRNLGRLGEGKQSKRTAHSATQQNKGTLLAQLNLH